MRVNISPNFYFFTFSFIFVMGTRVIGLCQVTISLNKLVVNKLWLIHGPDHNSCVMVTRTNRSYRFSVQFIRKTGDLR